MDFIDKLLLKMSCLSAICDTSNAILSTISLSEMLTAVFNGIVSHDLIRQTANALTTSSENSNVEKVVDEFVRAVNTTAARDSSFFNYLEHVEDAIESLLSLHGLIKDEFTSDIQLRFRSSLLFSFLRYLILSTTAAQPAAVLVGNGMSLGQRIEIPLRGEVLDNIELSYLASDPYPRWKTKYWAQFPPNPNRRRLDNWLTDDLVTTDTIEMYRVPIMGEDPLAVIKTEAVALPRTLALTNGIVSIDIESPELSGWQTTMYDEFNTLVLVVERFVVSPLKR